MRALAASDSSCSRPRVWQGTLSLPAGSYDYKAALDGSWDENYGAHGQLSGANIALALPEARLVKFYYDDDASHWVTDGLGSRIVTAAGSLQSELGCPGDWQPDCLRSWLQEVDGDQVYDLETTALPAGYYEARAAVNESWTESYAAGGSPGGANLPITVPADATLVRLRFDLLTIAVPEPAFASLALAALAALALCCARLDSRVNR